MANLRANKITSTEVFETTGSVQFNDAYLSFDKDILLDLNNYSDWTIECWIYRTANATNDRGLIIGIDASGNINSNILAVNNDGALYMGSDGGSNATPKIQTSNNTISFNTWYHISAVKKSTSIKLFVNGIESASGTRSTWTFTDLSIPGLIGSRQANDTEFFGHISNLRILKGTALYTKNFTPPTRELTVIPNTVLLACTSTTNAAREATGKTITVNGNAVANELTPGLLTDRVKSGGTSAITGSVEFSDGGDFLQIVRGSNTDFQFGTQDFTIEFFAHFAKTGMRIMSTGDNGNYTTGGWVFETNNQFGAATSSGTFTYFGTFTYPINSWAHISVVRNGSNIYGFVNGVQQWSNTISTNITFSGTNDFSLGTGRSGSSGVGNYNLTASTMTKGFISNLRIIKGTALYTGNFIPPSRELKRLPGTVLLCCKNTSDPTAEETGKTITPFGSLDRTNLGVELVTNGTFDNGTSGWVANGSGSHTFSVVSGALQVVRGSSGLGAGEPYQNIILEANKRYVISYQVTSGDMSVAIYDGTIGGTTLFAQNANLAGRYKLEFTNTGSTGTKQLLLITNNTNSTAAIDDVSVTKLDPGTKPPFTPSIGSDGSVTFDGVTKINTPNYFYLPTGNTEDRGRGRGVFGGGYNPTVLNTIDYVNIQSSGIAQDFGDLTIARTRASSSSSVTRGIFNGGETPTLQNVIDYITISVTSNAQDFGDLSSTKTGTMSCSSSTRGLFAGGSNPTFINTIEYITIASLGNIVNFGSLTESKRGGASCSSPTRGIFGGGLNTPTRFNTIEYITIASTGNAVDFGDLSVARNVLSSCSNSVRGMFAGGYTNTPAITNFNTIEYITIASTGNAVTFGNLSNSLAGTSSCSSSNRGIFAGGIGGSFLNTIEFVSIMSTGNAQDFGDLTAIKAMSAGLSDSHGGLG